MPFTFEKTPIEGLLLITPKVFTDDRGFFFESYKKSDFEKAAIFEEFVQDNQSFSVKNSIRGLHFQKDPFGQGKLVRCIRGTVWDAAVDLRKNSASFGKYFGVELSDNNKKMLYIPSGFAHGFAVLSEKAEFLYKCTAEYAPQSDCGIIWNDPDIGIKWPVRAEDAVLSDKDLNLKPFSEVLKENIL